MRQKRQILTIRFKRLPVFWRNYYRLENVFNAAVPIFFIFFYYY